jgi:cysteinyl-tRNA synthetase
MARRYLGDRFDLHTGGIDNVFPHHEDEIAQSAPLVGGPPARLWIHGEHLLMSGRKMAKSAGNFQRITELSDRGLDPLAFRYLTMTSRYSRKLNYSDTSIDAAAASLRSLRSRLAALGPPPDHGSWMAPEPLRAAPAGERPAGIATAVAGFGGYMGINLRDRAHAPAAALSAAGAELHGRFVAALVDDLDLPSALVVIRETLRSDLDPDERRWLVLDADAVLGLDLDQTWSSKASAGMTVTPSDVPEEIAELVAARSAARASHDYPRADELRDDLASRGWDVVDGAEGTRVLPH